MNTCTNIENIKLPNSLKQLNALQILEDEEYIEDRIIKSCYICEHNDFDYHFIKNNKESIVSFFNELRGRYSLRNTDFYIDFSLKILKKENLIKELSKGNHFCIVICKKCGSVLKINNYVVFDELPISIEAFEKWDLICLNSKIGILHDEKNTFSWKRCPYCGDVIYATLGFDGREVCQCHSCYKTFPYAIDFKELNKYL